MSLFFVYYYFEQAAYVIHIIFFPVETLIACSVPQCAERNMFVPYKEKLKIRAFVKLGYNISSIDGSIVLYEFVAYVLRYIDFR